MKSLIFPAIGGLLAVSHIAAAKELPTIPPMPIPILPTLVPVPIPIVPTGAPIIIVEGSANEIYVPVTDEYEKHTLFQSVNLDGSYGEGDLRFSGPNWVLTQVQGEFPSAGKLPKDGSTTIGQGIWGSLHYAKAPFHTLCRPVAEKVTGGTPFVAEGEFDSLTACANDNLALFKEKSDVAGAKRFQWTSEGKKCELVTGEYEAEASGEEKILSCELSELKMNLLPTALIPDVKDTPYVPMKDDSVVGDCAKGVLDNLKESNSFLFVPTTTNDKKCSGHNLETVVPLANKETKIPAYMGFVLGGPDVDPTDAPTIPPTETPTETPTTTSGALGKTTAVGTTIAIGSAVLAAGMAFGF